MNMLPSSNQPQNVRAEIVQNAPREMSIGMVMQSIWRHRFFMLVWLILVVGLASLVIFIIDLVAVQITDIMGLN